MSTELKSSGEIVGSQRYFFTINSKYFISKLMTNSTGYDYKTATDRICNYISDVLSEMYDDLSKHSQILPYVDSDDRKNTANFVRGLSEVQANYGFIGGRASDCISLLELNSFSIKRNSRASDNEINEGARKVNNNRYLSTSSSVDLINKVINNGMYSFPETENNCNCLLEILDKNDTIDFLKDVMVKYNYQNNERNYTGKNGKQICTKDYIEDLEKRIFYTELSKEYSMSNNPYVFKMFIDNAFIGVFDQLRDDLNQGVRDKSYVTPENKDNIRKCIKSLEEVNIKCYSLEPELEELIPRWEVYDIVSKLPTIAFDGIAPILVKYGYKIGSDLTDADTLFSIAKILNTGIDNGVGRELAEELSSFGINLAINKSGTAIAVSFTTGALSKIGSGILVGTAVGTALTAGSGIVASFAISYASEKFVEGISRFM
ncbi:MAG: hypothetical protein R3Y09_12400 [Clostridia bacterium]